MGQSNERNRMNSSKIDLTLFCAASGDPRIYLTRPFSIGDYTLASNGHILIRIDRRDDIPPPEDMPEKAAYAAVSQPDIAYKKLGTETGSLRLADFDPELVECDDCTGTGQTHTCPECGGNGTTDIWTSWDKEPCYTCDGSGAVSPAQMPSLLEKFPQSAPLNGPQRCESCYGIGKRCTDDEKYHIGAATLGSQYLLLAKTLPNAKVYAFSKANKNPQAKAEPTLIVFDGGLGILMPRRD
jgi:hypothetical protein